MYRCYVSVEELNDGLISLPAEEAHHLTRVLRAKTGDTLEVFDGAGRWANAVISEVLGKSVTVTVETIEFAPLSKSSVSLIQCIPKGKKMDLIVEKCAEMGVSRIYPVISENTDVILDDTASLKRLDRWGKVAVSAAKQCGGRWLPELRPVSDFSSLMKSDLMTAFDAVVICSLRPDTEPMLKALESINASAEISLALVIGPEGDFTEAETDLVLSSGAMPVSLGPNVLRSETAAFVGLSLLVSRFLY